MVDVVVTSMTDPWPQRLNLAEHVLSGGLSAPEKAALAVAGPSGDPLVMSHAEIRRAVLAAAGAFAAMDLPRGSRVMLRLGNVPAFPLLYLAAIAAGLVPVPTSAQLTRSEITEITGQLDPSLILAGEGIALPARPACPVLHPTSFDGLFNHPQGDFADTAAEDPAYILFTSGSSGKPRAVVHAHRAIWARRAMRAGWTGLVPSDRVMHAGAFNWSYTLGVGLMDPWTVGATAIIPAPGTGPADLPALMAEHGVTVFAAAPGIYRQMLRAAFPALPALRHGLSAGEALPPETAQAWRQTTGTGVHQALGMTECSTYLSGSPDRPAPEDYAGHVQPGRQIGIIGDHLLAYPGSRGQIAVHRSDPGLMLGYLDGDRIVPGPALGDWFLTGDLGEVGPGGTVRHLGRADAVMNAGGYRVSPEEVEAAMAACPGVTACAAYEHRLDGQRSVIALAYESAAEIPDTVLSAFAQDRLARYKQPRIWRHVAALPRTATGKISRKSLRDTR